MNGERMLELFNMSLTGSAVILLVCVLRLLLKRTPKKYVCLLWLIPFLRLLMPVAIPSPLSLLPVNARSITEISVEGGSVPALNTGIGALDSTVNLILMEALAPEPLTSADPAQILLYFLQIIWIAGAALFVGINGFRYWRLKRRAADAVPGEPGVYYSDAIAMPMVLGIIRPRIYLPSMFLKEENSEEKRFILAHETAHKRRFDHLTKLLGFAALAVHWFNPLVWAAFFLFCRDMEMACDEHVMEEMGEEKKKGYSMALLQFETRRSALLIPLAFGESHTKSRIRNILNYKKPGFWVSIAAILLLAAAAVTLLTSPQQETPASVAIIGGADGPTSIFLAGKIGGSGSSEPTGLAEQMDVEAARKNPYGVGVELDYVSAGKISLHGSFGYMSFSLSSGRNGGAKLERAVTLSEAGQIWMQGDSYTEVAGNEDMALIVTNAYSPDAEHKIFFYSETANVIEEQEDSEINQQILDFADQGVFQDAVLEDEYTKVLSGAVREQYGTGSQVIYGPAVIPETNSNIYGFLAADGENLEDIWYGIWNRDLGNLERIPLFE